MKYFRHPYRLLFLVFVTIPHFPQPHHMFHSIKHKKIERHKGFNMRKSFFNQTCESNPTECLSWYKSSPSFKDALPNYVKTICKNKQPKCVCERDTTMKVVEDKLITNTFIPECKSDGTYNETQCHTDTGYCWCVDPNGEPIVGSATTNQKPSCNIRSKMARNVRGGRRRRKRGCSRKERATFNRRIIKAFIREYEDSTKNQTVYILRRRKKSRLSKNEKKTIIKWKFNKTDSDNNGQLTRRELKPLKKFFKRSIKPRACAKSFDFDCDIDRNRRISLTEWTTCFTVYQSISFKLFLSLNTEDDSSPDNINTNNLASLSNGPSLYHKQLSFGSLNSNSAIIMPTILKATKAKPDCVSERNNELSKQNKNDQLSDIFVPNCTRDGLYAPLQCHKGTGYCWCVNKENGRPIPGTSQLGFRIDCDSSSKKGSRIIKGCDEMLKQQFLTRLMDDLSKEMVSEYAKNSRNFISWLRADQSLEEKAVRWKYYKMDTNKNGVMDKSEWPLFRKSIRKTKEFRKCVRNFQKYCDINQDKRVTISEWLECTGIKNNAASATL